MSIRISLTRASIAALLLSGLAMAGCDDGVTMTLDGAPVRDAAVSDGGGLLDGGTYDAGGPITDGAASDAGSPLCVEPVCDPRSADGCTGGACALWGDAASCEDAAGSLGPGAECATVDACAAGLACFDVDGVGRCGRICCPGDATACADGARCGGAGLLIDGAATVWGRCLPRRTCDVLNAAASCEPREGCYIVDATGMTECRVAGSAGAGESCNVQEDCAGGFFCGGIGSAKRCVRICTIGGDDCPVAEGRCVAQVHTPAGSGLCTFDAMTAR
jgi:hypothetical protein